MDIKVVIDESNVTMQIKLTGIFLQQERNPGPQYINSDTSSIAFLYGGVDN